MRGIAISDMKSYYKTTFNYEIIVFVQDQINRPSKGNWESKKQNPPIMA